MKIDRHGQAKILTAEELGRLMAELESDRNRALFAICLYSGCRINEACTLLKADVYDSIGVRDVLTIRRKNTKGEQSTRQISVSDRLKPFLEAYQDKAGKTYLFPGRHGRGHLNPRSADAILREACQRAELEGVSTHSFRRTALTMMSNASVPLRVIQDISGHRSLQALQRYLAVSEQQKEDAVSKIDFDLANV